MSNLKIVIDALGKVIQDGAVGIADEFIKSIGNLSNEEASLALNFQKIEKELWAFKESIGWVKSNFKKDIHNAAVIIKSSSEDGVKINLFHVFLDKNNYPMIESSYPMLMVSTSEFDMELRKNFGNKEMIILK